MMCLLEKTLVKPIVTNRQKEEGSGDCLTLYRWFI